MKLEVLKRVIEDNYTDDEKIIRVQGVRDGREFVLYEAWSGDDELVRARLAEGNTCKFPFLYARQKYKTCTKVGNRGIPWCALNTTVEGIVHMWGDCDPNSCDPEAWLPEAAEDTKLGNLCSVSFVKHCHFLNFDLHIYSTIKYYFGYS